MLRSEYLSVIERRLVVPIQVRQMDLEPSNPSTTKWFALCEHEKASRKVITHLIKVRWNRISTTSEVDIMREIELFS
jgi:hypothetical protein